jgi:hypothetical protein
MKMEMDLRAAAREVFQDDLYPLEWNEADRYFWVEGAPDNGEREYHWLADCYWLMVSLSRGGQLAVSTKPPANAAEARRDRRYRPTDRWLCRVCHLYLPQPEAPQAAPGDCLSCGCGRELHEELRTGAPMSGCWNASPQVIDDQVSLLHCRCDGYRPMAAACRPGAASTAGRRRSNVEVEPSG